MTFRNKTKQKYTQKRRRNRLKGGGDWYCRCDDTTKSKPSPSPAPAQSQFESAKKVLAHAEMVKKTEAKPNTTTLVPSPIVAPPDFPPAIVTPLKPCNTFKGRKCPKDRCQLESKKAAVQRTGKLPKKISENDLRCLPKQNGGYKSKKRSKKAKGGYKSKRRRQIKKKKSKKPTLVIF